MRKHLLNSDLFRSFSMWLVYPYKVLRRHQISVRAYRWLSEVQRPKSLMALKSSCKGSMHVVCPGPTARELLAFPVAKNDSIIFVNHGVGLAAELTFPPSVACYFITADTTRLMEILDSRSEALALCKSIFIPSNLCHLREKELFSSIDIILKPKVKIKFHLGLEIRNLGAANIRPLEERPSATGFGSLLFAFQFAALLGTKKIVLWGVDYGQVAGERYFDDKVFSRMDTPFNQIANDATIAKHRLSNQGIEILNGPTLDRS